ncbi:unnamed protein product, partial [Pylaiella littoralis]
MLAGCMEHGLRVCREGWKPSDFSLAHMRLATAADGLGSPLLLPSAGRTSVLKTRKLREVSADFGIFAAQVSAVQMDRYTGDSSAAARGSPTHTAPPRVHSACAAVIQLWGLAHSVELAATQTVAIAGNMGKLPLLLSPSIVGALSKERELSRGIFKFADARANAKVTLDTEKG